MPGDKRKRKQDCLDARLLRQCSWRVSYCSNSSGATQHARGMLHPGGPVDFVPDVRGRHLRPTWRAASPATRSVSDGLYRTSRRCYDNAQLSNCYRLLGSRPEKRSSRRPCARPSSGCAICARRVAAFAPASMQDSEGVEGKFYVWTRDEIEEVLGTRRTRAFFARHYDGSSRRPIDPRPRGRSDRIKLSNCCGA